MRTMRSWPRRREFFRTAASQRTSIASRFKKLELGSDSIRTGKALGNADRVQTAELCELCVYLARRLHVDIVIEDQERRPFTDETSGERSKSNIGAKVVLCVYLAAETLGEGRGSSQPTHLNRGRIAEIVGQKRKELLLFAKGQNGSRVIDHGQR